jgi:hypothetical protein
MAPAWRSATSSGTRPVTEVVAPPRLVNLPGHTGVFAGRGGELADLEAALRAAVHGLGGVGKSTLAARYARAHAAGRTAGGGLNVHVWWRPCQSAGCWKPHRRAVSPISK